MSQKRTGIKLSDKTKELMSNQRKGVKQIDRFINAYGMPMAQKKVLKDIIRIYLIKKNQEKEKKLSKETKKKLSIKNKGEKSWNKGLSKESDERIK